MPRLQLTSAAHERARLLAVESYQILDTPADPLFDRLTELAAHLTHMPMAAISLIDRGRQWFKSRVGIGVTEIPRSIAFGALALQEPEILVIPDTTDDERLNGNPLVFSDPRFHFYAGVPLITAEGFALGTIEVFDMVPRELDEAQQTALKLLARVVVSELDQRRKTTQNLESLRSLVEASPLAIYAIDTLGRVTLWNQSAEDMFGWSAQEAIGRTLPTVVPERQAEFEWMLGRTLEGEDFRLEVLRQKKDGTHIPVCISCAPLRTPSGKIVGAMALAEDLSERREAEERLRQAQKMEAVGQLAGGVAHDFNNQLMVIRGYSELLLQQEPGNSKAHGQLEKVLKAADQASALNNQLLAFSRRQVLQPRVLDMNQVLRDLTSTLRRMIDKNIMLDVQPAEMPSMVKADLGQMQQVIFNLALNARDAMPNGGTLLLAMRHEQIDGEDARRYGCSPGEYVCLTARDTGMGIDAAILPHIFEPFFTTKEAGKGTGLGLATVYGVVQQSGGSIQVESEITQGATFRVYFPSVISKPTSGRLSSVSQLPRGTETILLVEDERPLAIMEYEFLQGLGYTVQLAHDGQQAAELVEDLAKPVDLLVADMVMPNLSGAELARRLRARQPQLKVVLVSGYTEQGPGPRGEVPEDMDYLQKPYTLSVLVKKIREVLDAPPRHTAAASDKTGT